MDYNFNTDLDGQPYTAAPTYTPAPVTSSPSLPSTGSNWLSGLGDIAKAVLPAAVTAWTKNQELAGEVAAYKAAGAPVPVSGTASGQGRLNNQAEAAAKPASMFSPAVIIGGVFLVGVVIFALIFRRRKAD